MAIKRANLVKVVKTVFAATGDLRHGCTYNSTPAITPIGDYNVTTGVATTTSTGYPLKDVLFCDFEEKETDHDVVVLTDQKMLFPRDDLPVAISPGDNVLDDIGRTWEVIRQMGDPADVLGKVHVRTSR